MKATILAAHRWPAHRVADAVAFSDVCALKILLVLGLLGLMSSCNRNAAPGPFPKASLIIISVDTLRSDHLPIYGYPTIETPHIDRFADDGIVFERAYSQSPLTLPAHTTVFTGLLPPEHGVRDNSFYEVPMRLNTLAERLFDQGYVTGGVVSSVVLGQRTGIQQGFHFYQSDIRDQQGRPSAAREGPASIALALNWLEKQTADRSSFLFLHLFEPHSPYQPPEPFASATAHPYDGEIVYTDFLLGQFFDALKKMGRYQESMILLISDHGEGLGDHGEAEHGILLHREALQVPMVLKLPGNQRQGTRLDQPAMLADIKPTLERLLGLTQTPVTGRDLFDAKTNWEQRPVFAETRYPFNNYGYPPGESVIRGDYHYIRQGGESLYQMIEDPAETENLLPQKLTPGPITAYLEAVGAGFESKSGESGDDLELLASLGYSAVEVKQAQNLDRPMSDLMDALSLLDEAAALVKDRKFAKARDMLERLLVQQPCLHQARLDVGRLLAQRGDLVALEKHYEQALLCDAANLRFLMLTGELKIRRGHLEEARRLAEHVWIHGTNEAKGEFAYFFQRYGASEDAARLADLLMKGTERNPHAGLILGEQAFGRGALQEALTALVWARDEFGKRQSGLMLAKASFFIGECHRMNDSLALALTAYREALKHRPDDSATRVSATLVLAGQGKTRAAIQMMDDWVGHFPSHVSYAVAARTMLAIEAYDAAAFFEKQSQKYPPMAQSNP